MAGEFDRYARQAFREMERGGPHPAMTELAGYVHGTLPSYAIPEIDAHLMKCPECSERVEEFRLFAADCDAAATGPHRVYEEEYRELRKRIKRRSPIAFPRSALALAACVVAAIGVAVAAYRIFVPSTGALLADAYRERRTSELRMAGAAWAEFRQERGGGSSAMPLPWYRAQSRIREKLQNSGGDPETLRLEGQAEAICGNAAAAVDALKRSLKARAGDAKTLSDLGSAYALLGDTERDYGDYKQALDAIDRSLRLRGRDAETLFNKAVVLEKLLLYPEAEAAWKDYLKVDPAGPWPNEARTRLEGIEKKLRDRERKTGEVRDDPGYFLKSAENADAESWLISSVSTRWLARSSADSAAREAVAKLAQVLASRHGDTWLADMTAPSCTTAAAAAALAQLMDADAMANKGQYAAAMAAERRVADIFRNSGCAAGAARARLSEIVALHNAFQHRECFDQAAVLGRELQGRSYIRLRARVAREYATCATRLGRLDDADAALREALRLSRAARYGATALEIENMNLDKTNTSEVPSEVMAAAEDSLRIFWSGAYAGYLAYPALSELRMFAERAGEPNAALYFARSAVWSAGGAGGLPILEVSAYGDLAVAERELGDDAAARADLAAGERIARKIPAQYQVAPAAALARLDLTRGDTAAALAGLAPFTQLAPGLPWLIAGEYYTALGETLFKRGALAEARAAFRTYTDSTAKFLVEAHDEDERAGVLRSMEGAYRGLVELELASTPGGEARALGIWRTFRNLDAPRGADPAVTDATPTLWFVELPDRYVAWFSRGGQTTFHSIEAPRGEVADLASRFLGECSDPGAPQQTLQSDSQRLYRALVQPFESELVSAGGALAFQLDGALTALPLNALMSRDGSRLGDLFTVTVSTGPRTRVMARNLNAGATVLAVANPAISGPSAARFPPLTDTIREVGAIRASFPNHVLLEGRGATMGALERELPRADIVHFAGHGYSANGNGGLLFAPEDPATSDYRLLRADEMRRMNWSRCRLAVLSACAAASGETRGAHNPESLIRALVRAGAPDVVASLWNVDSAAAADLMSRFYASLRNGLGPAEALREAQRGMRVDASRRHPYYWAGFQLYGTT